MSGKTLDNSSVRKASIQVPDLKVVGNGDMFKLLCKASSKAEMWMKSTKAMEIPRIGCIVQVTTQQGSHSIKNDEIAWSVAEALVFVPGVRIVSDDNDGHKLIRETRHLP